MTTIADLVERFCAAHLPVADPSLRRALGQLVDAAIEEGARRKLRLALFTSRESRRARRQP